MQAMLSSAEDLGRLVRQTRLSYGLTQRELAQQLNVTQRWLYELETGKGKQLNARLFTVLDLLGISLTGTTTLGPKQ